MNGLPYFPMYASDFLSGVADMPLDDRGAYITLICHQWVNGSIPSDLASCARICGGGTVSERVLTKFRNVDGTPTMTNARLERERVKCLEAREKAKKRKTKWKERGRNANGTRSGTVPDTSRERLGSDSDSLLPLGKSTEPGKASKPTKKPIQVASMPKGLEPLLDDFNAWLSQRGTGAKRATSKAVELAQRSMVEWGPEKSAFILRKAIIGSHQGLNDYGEFDRIKKTADAPKCFAQIQDEYKAMKANQELAF